MGKIANVLGRAVARWVEVLAPERACGFKSRPSHEVKGWEESETYRLLKQVSNLFSAFLVKRVDVVLTAMLIEIAVFDAPGLIARLKLDQLKTETAQLSRIRRARHRDTALR